MLVRLNHPSARRHVRLRDARNSLAQLHDATKPNADPTGTIDIRRRYRSLVEIRWRKMRAQLQMAIVQQDMLGLDSEQKSPLSIALSALPADGKIRAFQNWLDATLNRVTIEYDTAYLDPMVAAAYNRAVARAMRLAKSTAQPQNATQAIASLQQLVMVELQGINEAFSQRVVRLASNALIERTPANALFKDAAQAIEQIGIVRSRAMVETYTVKANATGTLDQFEAAGITKVGLIPELRPKGKVTKDFNPYHDPATGEFTFGGMASTINWSGASSSHLHELETNTAKASEVGKRLLPAIKPFAEGEVLRHTGETYVARVGVEHKAMAQAIPEKTKFNYERGYVDPLTRTYYPASTLPTAVETSSLSERNARLRTLREMHGKDFNPYHVPAGSPDGGEFTSAEYAAGLPSWLHAGEGWQDPTHPRVKYGAETWHKLLAAAGGDPVEASNIERELRRRASRAALSHAGGLSPDSLFVDELDKFVALQKDAPGAAGTGPGARIFGIPEPSISTISRIRRAQANVEALGEVDIVTAGDFDVCPICLDLEDGGPYTINEARSLIPAHPWCRCAFVPSVDARFAEEQ